MNDITIFLDLDDTLADTSERIGALFGYDAYEINHNPLKKSWRELLKDYRTWNHIKQNPSFWSSIALNRHALELYGECCLITPRVKVLTALPKAIFAKNTRSFQAAALAKKQWVAQHFPLVNEVIVTHAVDKHLQIKHTPGRAVLIDDSLKNIARWTRAGGTAFHINHHDTHSVDQLFVHLHELKLFYHPHMAT